MRPIQDGDIVEVVMSRNDVFPFQGSLRFKAKVLYAPGGTGDLWYFQVDKQEIAINPSAAEFIGLIKVDEEEFGEFPCACGANQEPHAPWCMYQI